MVNQYESDDLRTKDEMLNPYSDLNKSTHAVDYQRDWEKYPPKVWENS